MTNSFSKLCVAVLIASAPLAVVAGCCKKGRCTTTQKKKVTKKCRGGRCR